MERDIVAGNIDYFDDKGIAVSDRQSWARELPVHCNDVVDFAQPLHWLWLHLRFSFCTQTETNKLTGCL